MVYYFSFKLLVWATWLDGLPGRVLSQNFLNFWLICRIFENLWLTCRTRTHSPNSHQFQLITPAVLGFIELDSLEFRRAKRKKVNKSRIGVCGTRERRWHGKWGSRSFLAEKNQREPPSGAPFGLGWHCVQGACRLPVRWCNVHIAFELHCVKVDLETPSWSTTGSLW